VGVWRWLLTTHRNHCMPHQDRVSWLSEHKRTNNVNINSGDNELMSSLGVGYIFKLLYLQFIVHSFLGVLGTLRVQLLLDLGHQLVDIHLDLLSGLGHRRVGAVSELLHHPVQLLG
jgi:hypothetical protein